MLCVPSKVKPARCVPTRAVDTVTTVLTSSGFATDDCRQTTVVADDHDAVTHALRAKLALVVASTVAKLSPATVTLCAVESARLAALTSLIMEAAGRTKYLPSQVSMLLVSH